MNLENGQTVMMSELQVGDQVQTGIILLSQIIHIAGIIILLNKFS